MACMSTRRRFLQTGATSPPPRSRKTSRRTTASASRPSDSAAWEWATRRYAVSIPGVELAAVCDIYDGRLTRASETHGDQLFTTRDYREVLARKDIDAVIIATPDHWHARPLDRRHGSRQRRLLREADGAIDRRRQARYRGAGAHRPHLPGGQPVRHIGGLPESPRPCCRRAPSAGLTMVEAWLDRNTALGAWQYSIPPDASPATVDWDRFLGKAPKRPFEPIRLFRWRNYQDYGTGVAGDLFVHLLSGLHLVTGSLGPERIVATGGLRYWNDGRDVPDVMLAMIDYGKQPTHPEFTLSLRVNLKSGVPEERFGFRFMGSDGVITTSMSSLLLEKAPPEARARLQHRDLSQGGAGASSCGSIARSTRPAPATRRRSRPRNSRRRKATTRIASTIACSTRPCAAARSPSRTPYSASAPPVRRCWPIRASSKSACAIGIRRR